MPLEIRPAYDRLDLMRELLREYAIEVGADVVFQGFESELYYLPNNYKPPEGRLLIALLDGIPVGCVALRKFRDKTCEMKRLYVRLFRRGQGIGTALAKTVMAEARAAGYEDMVLDTVTTLVESIPFYGKLGFETIEPHHEKPRPNAVYFKKRLTSPT